MYYKTVLLCTVLMSRAKDFYLIIINVKKWLIPFVHVKRAGIAMLGI